MITLVLLVIVGIISFQIGYSCGEQSKPQKTWRTVDGDKVSISLVDIASDENSTTITLTGEVETEEVMNNNKEDKS